MVEQIDPSDVTLNRSNLTLARSRKVLQSWLPPATPTNQASTGEQREATAADDDEDDYSVMTEAGGIGSKRAFGDDGEDSIPEPLRKKRATNEKLLEQLLGRKAAQARREKVQVEKTTVGPNKGKTATPMNRGSAVQQNGADSGDEEDGRAAAVTSRKKMKLSKKTDGDREDPDAPQEEANGTKAERDEDGLTEDHEALSTSTAPSSQSRPPTRKKATSYLDEILAQSAHKKKKKKKKQQAKSLEGEAG